MPVDPDPNSSTSVAIDFMTLLANHGFGVLIVVLLLICSAVASGTEVAFFSLSQAEIQEFKRENGRVWNLLHRPKRLLATILVFNNLVNVAIILISTMEVSEFFALPGIAGKPWVPWLRTILEVGVITFVLLFFGEITPKVYASQNRLKIVRALAVPVQALRLLLSPVSVLLISTTNFLDRRISTNSEAASFEDIKHAIDLTSEEESPEEEKEILKGIVNFSNTPVKAVMHSRVDIQAVEWDTSLEELINIVNQQGYSRMPVYQDSLDSIKGILYIKDLIPLLRSNNKDSNWQALIRPTYFIPETKKIDDLLDEFKSRRLHIAIVVDEFGGTSGLVTLEDIIEEIFGEIVDEFDEEEMVFSKLSDNIYIFDGKMPLNDIVRTVGLPDNVFEEIKGDADTLAGLILEIHGKIPEKDEVISEGDFIFTIESVAQNRIKRVKFETTLELETTEKAEEAQ
jgi:gliding motility-associated protein GldE